MHFFVQSSPAALAPLTPHFESLIQPFTVCVSLANETDATIRINQPASKNERIFRISSSSVWFPHVARTPALYHRKDGGCFDRKLAPRSKAVDFQQLI